MRAGIWNPQTMSVLEELATKGLVQASETELVKQSYMYLRAIESVLRRWENKSISSLPLDETEQRKLAHRMGAESLDSFGQRYREAREAIHAVYSRYIRG
jgi:glutamine synthetase adenylyltransferase